MKVFLSWSGSESKQLATIFKEWLPNVLQYVEPYMSAKDISLGERWNNSIIENLDESSFGLIFVTPSNINAPWINYEAGALSKTMDSKVVPILYNAEVMMLNEGPLKQFQSAKDLEKESILSLLKSINISKKEGKLDEARLEKAFEMWWEDLEKSINGITVDNSMNKSNENEPTDRELLSVIFSKLSEQERFFKRNENINIRSNDIPFGLINDIKFGQEMLKKTLRNLEGGPFPDEFFNDINDGIEKLDHAIRFLINRVDKTRKYKERLKSINE
ncbi:hypothetical protein J27TS8_05130 [Robertmurraya siralis]|uniref:TIR domain-containing protein n=1 Tax=Robertmurraya siralis TaxID=77777 RepID=A0A919WEP7_9BACI|nr:toll/interleukin-1 receptor domain-containing protein [Robertmurraya siralis]PAE21974.1 hypothetical protein CHH80_03510 [Bacillus sp. 7504-2]GIN60520.1 hypothetical protein J27TS8_05130 [Robertmurraya siralis]